MKNYVETIKGDEQTNVKFVDRLNEQIAKIIKLSLGFITFQLNQ